MLDYCRRSDHDDLVRILLINLRRGNMEAVLKSRYEALYDHSFFFQAVHPGSAEPEGHYCYSHIIHNSVYFAEDPFAFSTG